MAEIPAISRQSFGPVKGASKADIDALVEAILDVATLAEKVAMMSGKGFFKAYQEDGAVWAARPYRAGAGCERLGVPALWFTDGPRGVCRGNSTCFPVTMARGASWDVDLERRIGEAMAIEARAQGCNLSGAVCVNLLRHPAWGRAQETYGEDPFHLGEMGAALATGLQTHNVIATVKHLAVNSIENARFKIDVRAEERALREVYLPHFKRIIDAGCASVMSAYNKLNGEYCGQNRWLLTDLLRHEWGFDGFVHSDWILGVYEVYGASAGLDIENPEPRVFGDALLRAVESGAVEPQVIDTACRRILSTLYRFACANDPLEAYAPDLVGRREHVELALEAAEKSAVLLCNSGVLPISRDMRVGVFGQLASLENTGDHGSSRVRPPHVVTPLQGLADHLGAPDMAVLGDEMDPAAAAEAARGLDAAIIIAGYTRIEEGEFIPGDMTLGREDLGPALAEDRTHIGGDREALTLPERQVALIRAVAAANPNTIIVLVAGSAVIVEDWIGEVAAVLQTFYSGMEGGRALARLLYGEVSPSGKLPFTVARRAEDYPFFDRDAERIEYGPYCGYTLFDREKSEPRFAFGHGLSYARFKLRALKVRKFKGGIEASVAVRNDGTMAADDVVQLYAGFPGKVVERPVRLLRGFERVSLRPGETKVCRFFVPAENLTFWNPATRAWQAEPGEHRIMAGRSSDDPDMLVQTVDL